MNKIIFITFLLITSSCTTEVGFNKLKELAPNKNKQQAGLSTQYQTFYTGSDKEFDYFEVTNFINSKPYKVKRSESRLKLRFNKEIGEIMINIKDMDTSKSDKGFSLGERESNIDELLQKQKLFEQNDKTLLD